jgi:hypothetical protein
MRHMKGARDALLFVALITFLELLIAIAYTSQCDSK